MEQLCSRLLIIDHGTLLYDGSLDGIRDRLGTERILVVDLAEDCPGVLNVPPAREVRADGPRRWLQFSRLDATAGGLIAAVAARYRLHDLTIEEPDIETIVRHIYEDGFDTLTMHEVGVGVGEDMGAQRGVESPQLTPDLNQLNQLRQLNWLDWLIVVLLLASALEGTRRGVLLGTLDLVGAAVGVVLALVVEHPLGDEVAARVPALPSALAHLGVFLVVLIVVQMLIGATLGRLALGISHGIARGPLGCLDRLLGAVPGLLRGVIIVTLCLMPFALLPLLPQVSQAIQQSSIANRLVAEGLQLMPSLEARLGQDLQGGLPGLVVAPPEAESETTRPLPLGPPVGNLVPDADAERRMLDLVNAERSSAGLKPLVADDRLREVARQHSLEMFQGDYFSHTSPTTGSPFDRMRTAGIAFLVAGENLAFAPNVDIAHRGLMNSPGHRANILRPEFGRVGIGVIRSPAQGSMFSQEFTN